MDLILQRERIAPSQDAICTQGELLGLGFTCYTIERAMANPPEDDGHVAIPAGGPYPLTCYLSPRHHFDVPLVNDVPKRAEIELHPANWAVQLLGCIAPGLQRGTLGDAEKNIPNGTPAVLMSDAAFDRIMSLLNAAWGAGETVNLYVKDPQ